MERRVLLFVATRRDAEVSQRLLASVGIPTFLCTQPAEFPDRIREGAAAVLATEEILDPAACAPLLAALNAQEEWSDLPLIVLMHDARRNDTVTATLRRTANLITLERPTGMQSMLSAVRAAIRARQRQYETRAHIQAITAAETRAREADRAKNDFLAALSHELRTPLTPVLLAASDAMAKPGLETGVREAFEIIVKNVGLEARLIDDLLDLTRITHGKLKLDLAPLDLREVLRDSLATVRPEIAEKRLTLVEDFHGGPTVVLGDATRLQQVLWNVLRNAVKFTPVGGTITVQTFLREGMVVVAVTDTGIGLEPDEAARAFDAFAQGEHARHDGPHRFGGLGLGLAISHSLVTMHGGRIIARSTGRGQGATFEISLPTTAAAPVRIPKPGNSAPAARRKLRVLLVEDHDASRETLRRMLQARGFVVTTAASVEEARVRASESPFELLLTDIGLPDGTGYDLLRAVPPGPHRLAVALTGYGMENDVARSKEAGFFAHVTKPLLAAQLDAVLGEVAAALPAAPDWSV